MNRRLLVVGSMAVFAAVVVIGLVAAPGSPQDRVAALAGGIRCPVCQNEAIADSPSETARQMLAIVEEKVDAGESDEEIERYFVQRYGEWILLDPPLDRRFLLLWALPVVALVLGVFGIARRRRRAQPAQNVETPLDLRRQAEADIEELTAQVDEGEIPVGVAEDLFKRYRREIKAADRDAKARAREKQPDRQRRSRGRLVVGWLIGALTMMVAVVMAAQAVERETPAPPSAVPRDLSNVSIEEMERVVAENPDVVGMRLALADRYFGEEDCERALFHYLNVIQRDDSQADAWARAGWCIYQMREVELATGYVERSLMIAPDDPESKLYLGMILLYGQDDPEAALPLLREIDQRTDVPPDIARRVDEAIAAAERLIAEGTEG